LQSVPLAIVAVSYSVAVFPTLAQIFKRKEIDVFLDKMGTALRHIIFWSMPAMVFFIVLRAQIVRVVLGARQFSWSDTRITAAALALFIISIVAQGFVLIFVRAYYAGGRTMKPLIINGSTSLLTIVFAFVLVKLFDLWPFFRFFWISILRVDDVSVAKVLMLPLAYSLNNLINAWLLWLYFEKDFGRLPGLVRRAGFECFSAAVISGFFVYETLDLVGRVLSLNSFWGVFLQGFLSGLVGIVVLVAILKSMGNRELSEVYTSLHGRIWRQQRIITDENV
ncbi:MAG: lipid II flippase MurJ, partial [bacterium]